MRQVIHRYFTGHGSGGCRYSCLFAVLCALAGCSSMSTTKISDWTIDQGIGFRSDGPNMKLYADGGTTFTQATRFNWWQPRASVDSFSRLDEIFQSTVSKRSPPVSPWVRKQPELSLTYAGATVFGGGVKTINDYFDRNPTTSMVIAQGDTLLLERYQYGRQPDQRLTSFSMAKTVIAMLVGVALAEGKIHSLDDVAQAYAPELTGTEYGQTPLRHLLTMSSGVEFREEYDGQDDSARLSRATIMGQSAGGSAVAKLFNRRIAAPGARWYYASAETFILALVLRQATSQSIATYFSEKIWKHLGAEQDATWLVDASGQEVGYMGFNATARDYARLGMLMARLGRAGDQQLIPANWVREMTQAHVLPSRTGRWFGYGYQTWIFPELDASYAFQGVRGQAIFVDPARELVLVHLAVRASPRDPGGADTSAFWRALKQHIERRPS